VISLTTVCFSKANSFVHPSGQGGKAERKVLHSAEGGLSPSVVGVFCCVWDTSAAEGGIIRLNILFVFGVLP